MVHFNDIITQHHHYTNVQISTCSWVTWGCKPASTVVSNLDWIYAAYAPQSIKQPRLKWMHYANVICDFNMHHNCCSYFNNNMHSILQYVSHQWLPQILLIKLEVNREDVSSFLRYHLKQFRLRHITPRSQNPCILPDAQPVRKIEKIDTHHHMIPALYLDRMYILFTLYWSSRASPN